MFKTSTAHAAPRRSPACGRRPGQRRSEAGSIAIMTSAVLILMVGMFGVALDLSRAYNRKMELQMVADITALAAANALDGTEAGIERAVAAATVTANSFSFSYSRGSVAWSPEALSFGTAPSGGSGGWVDNAVAKSDAGRVFFVRVDTARLDAGHGHVTNVLVPVMSSAFGATQVTAVAVAGRDAINALPLAICANSNVPASALASGELVEFGFRRGVSYNLMNLNPGGRTPEHFLVNPISLAGTGNASMLARLDIVSTYICTGKMAIPALQGGAVAVERGFPLEAVYPHLNTRFGTYIAPCTPYSAPADPNQTEFDLTHVGWMKDKPDGLSANALPDPEMLVTVAEKPAGATGTAYGPLWSYARAAKHSSWVSNRGVEPLNGYATYNATDWGTLYKPGTPGVQNYPGSTPYQTTGGANAYKTIFNTRVLRVPLLNCPVAAGAKASAQVVGIGRFFMTVKATSSAVYGEFAGAEAWSAIGGSARLY
ncbi:MAG: pilus assembly protein TadG-related protein [Pseudomonadota bacterium]